MSGGSYDYAYFKVEEMAGSLTREADPLRKKFGVLLTLVAKAMHDIEWVDSYDISPGGEIPAIEAALVESAKTAALVEAAWAWYSDIKRAGPRDAVDQALCKAIVAIKAGKP